MATSPTPPMPMPSANARGKGLFVMFVLGACVIFMSTVLVVLVGMLPSLVAFFTDRRREKYAGVAVGALNFCGLLPFLIGFWKQGTSFASALTAIADPLMWLSAYGAAAIGWAIYYSMPSVCASYLRIQNERRVAKLKEYQKDLVEEWGEGITQPNKGDGASKG